VAQMALSLEIGLRFGAGEKVEKPRKVLLPNLMPRGTLASVRPVRPQRE
jgi:hypothetical protein